ncbi:uncharacterized protein TA05620 [Theileria annulata]|uniref:Peptidase A1 domain-containing protein n=1 Tax=Theileria annulata TaxID=5874 RepID=Q4UHM9_THEAN|nr:uncharacterized protein TA05620 [Theileria annulata]CAI73410.1 hypothetical protein, conserved [Theileria annulata]|eukprot:XP_954087.1 hypothetical protein, conserved [Theileria annulata]
MMGGIDKRFYKGDLYMLPVIRELYWEIKLYELWIGNIKLCCNNESYIIFDSGTSFNTMPHTEFLLFKQYIKPKYCNGLENIYEEYPIIKYKLEGGIEINIEPQEYIFLHKDKCRIAYMQIDVPSSYGRAFILGTQAFMTHYYTVYQRQPPMVRYGACSNSNSTKTGSLTPQRGFLTSERGLFSYTSYLPLVVIYLQYLLVSYTASGPITGRGPEHRNAVLGWIC